MKQKKSKMESTRDGFGKALLQLGKNKQVVVLTANLGDSVRAKKFKEKYPDRFFDVGVAEQNMLGIATGLAKEGKIPFATSFAVFSPGRNWDQLRVSICYSQSNVKLFSSHAGLTTGPDGATHQALEDIAITRVLPNLTVLVPCDSEEARKATIAAAKHKGPVYIRGGRAKVAQITTSKSSFTIGKADVLKRGKDITIIACGIMVHKALQAADILKKEHDLSAEVINVHTIKPLDEKTIIRSSKKTGCVLTAEEHQIYGGLGSAVAQTISKQYPVPVISVGVDDVFGESGTAEEVLKKYHLTVQEIVKKAKQVRKKRKK